MAKFCAKCNSPLNEGDRACGYCGTPVAEAPASAPAKKSKVDVAKLMKDPKAKMVAIVAAAVVVVLLIVAIISGAGYKGVAKKNLNAYIKNKPEKFINTLSGMYFDEDFDEEEMAELEENLSESIKNKYENYEDKYGKNVKIKYEIIGSYDLSESTLEDYEDRLEDLDIDYGKQLKGKAVVLLITIKGDDEERTYSDEMYLLKEDGKWKVAVPAFYY